MAVFNVLKLTPVKTYATHDNAVKAVEKRVKDWVPAGGTDKDLLFNVIILQDDSGRYFPVICNTGIHSDGFYLALRAGFNVIN